ncbi:hypothetical protein AT705_03170 [Pseudoalteromonas rubra]|uniref:Uncharacterized protein n=2 Tax=Pseudoalteromonas rubra TaxID=43658 RepID=A0A0U3HGC4_9GAMM|nr:hypothetical protein AT705_03170 [Pseudoalteromonas rubra]
MFSTLMRKKLYLLALMCALCQSASVEANPCKNVSGTLSVWNGHPPSLRISGTADGNIYGVEEAGEGPSPEALPTGLYARILSGENHITATFCLDILKENRRVVYEGTEIRLMRITSYTE